MTIFGSYIGNKILLTTPLLKCYLEHGLVVTHVYETVEYTPEACFKHFGESVSAAHRLGDENPEHAIHCLHTETDRKFQLWKMHHK